MNVKQKLAVALPLIAVFLLWAAGCSAALPSQAAAPVPQAGPSSSGTTYYVAPDGDDAAPGTEAAPWRTIQHAADVLAPGETVYVRGGVYEEAVTVNVSGSAGGGYITFRNYPGETPVLDGAHLTVPDDYAGLFLILDQSYLVIQGFEIRDYATTTRWRVPAGIHVRGASHHIRLLGNTIHHIANTAPLDGDLNGADAHGIAFYGDQAPASIHNILVQGNELHDLTLGSSEALVFNGNVEAFTVTQNIVRDCDNIGIVMIGYEGTAPDPAYDRARDGLVSENTVYRIDSEGNPSYAGERSAGGIYVDGGTRITVERNAVHHANIGIEVASEHGGRDASYVIVRSNFVSYSHTAGLAMGGYDSSAGSAHHNAILNNTFFQNDTDENYNGELLLQYAVHDNVIQNNILYAGAQNLLIGSAFSQVYSNVVDYNLYFTPGGAAESEWMWAGQEFIGFDAYRAATGNDPASQFADPLLVNPALPDLHLTAASPAIDAGAAHPEGGSFDIDGGARTQGAAVDLGADEFSGGGGDFWVYLAVVWLCSTCFR